MKIKHLIFGLIAYAAMVLLLVHGYMTTGVSFWEAIVAIAMMFAAQYFLEKVHVKMNILSYLALALFFVAGGILFWKFDTSSSLLLSLFAVGCYFLVTSD